MSAPAQDGVVSDFGRAYDVPNLFVSDGSVMTTWAAANSMLPIGRWCCARLITLSSR
jgi:choline dehydrogenase-like flavoprotein